MKKFTFLFLIFATATSFAQVPTGAINGLFTTDEDGTMVYFSQGNLQYQASTNTWRFAENQWDYVGTQTSVVDGYAGGLVDGSDNAYISPSYSGWIDLFGWGTGNNPTNSSTSNSSYSTFTDWGTNPISNGGNTTNQWHTLTSNEWGYLMFNRTTTSGIRYAKATVNNVKGLIILPDNWSASYYTLNNTDTADADFSVNIISSVSWIKNLETHGAVFLPVTGWRDGTEMWYVGKNGDYWSSTPNGSGYAYYLTFDASYIYHMFNEPRPRYGGRAVRLVYPSQATECINEEGNDINIYPNPTKNIMNIEADGMTRIRLFDMMGQMLLEKQVQGNNAQIDLRQYAAGQYFVQINTGKTSIVKKVMKR